MPEFKGLCPLGAETILIVSEITLSRKAFFQRHPGKLEKPRAEVDVYSSKRVKAVHEPAFHNETRGWRFNPHVCLNLHGMRF